MTMRENYVRLLLSGDREVGINLVASTLPDDSLFVTMTELPEAFSSRYLADLARGYAKSHASNIVTMLGRKNFKLVSAHQFDGKALAAKRHSTVFFADISPSIDDADSFLEHIDWLCCLSVVRFVDVVAEIPIRESSEANRAELLLRSLGISDAHLHRDEVFSGIFVLTIMPSAFCRLLSARGSTLGHRDASATADFRGK